MQESIWVRFFFRDWLSGCMGAGSRLVTRIGERKVPHFGHHPEMVEKCRGRNMDETIADHLFIH